MSIVQYSDYLGDNNPSGLFTDRNIDLMKKIGAEIWKKGKGVGNKVYKYYRDQPAAYPGTGGTRPLPTVLTHKKKMPARRGKYKVSETNALAGRASMKRQTKKVKLARRKKVRVPKKLRKQVNQILTGKELTGKFVTIRQGTIGVAFPKKSAGPVTVPTYSILGTIGVSPAIFQLVGQGNINSYSSWFMPIKQQAGTNSVELSTFFDPSGAFTYFHPAKIMDAASCMWNRKIPNDVSWLTQDGNIQTRANTSNGAVGDTNRVSNVRFHIVNSYVEFELKNNSQRELQVRILGCAPKHKILNNYPLNTWIGAVAEDQSENGAIAGVDPNTPALNPRDLPYFNGQYKTDITVIKIRPGETCKHSVQGPRNVVFDTSKYLVNNLDGEQYNMKNTYSCIFQVLPDMQVDQSVLWPGRFHSVDTGDDLKVRMPLSIETHETFILKCPETAGFIERAVVAGSAQPLNLKRRITMINNVANRPEGNAQAYTVVEEEQPATTIPSNSLLA